MRRIKDTHISPKAARVLASVAAGAVVVDSWPKSIGPRTRASCGLWYPGRPTEVLTMQPQTIRALNGLVCSYGITSTGWSLMRRKHALFNPLVDRAQSGPLEELVNAPQSRWVEVYPELLPAQSQPASRQ
jgi:hypothetical protein